MRLKCVLVALAVLFCGISVTNSAQAGGDRGYYTYQPIYYKKVYPRHKKRHYRRPVEYLVTDPYAYRYEPRGYYPYYNSGYWRPLCASNNSCVPRAMQPPYYQAWGYPKPVYYERIRPWHW